MAYGQGSALPGITTSLLRKSNPPSSVPKNEGDGKGALSSIASAESDKDGYVTFKHLVQHNPDDKSDYYSIKCTPSKTKGDFIFKERVDRYYPLYDKELLLFPFNATGSYTPHIQGGINLPVAYGESIIWNH
ncbi:MAG: hypothetical protein IPJ93_06465 [Bacteroidota bacterium]|nr:MAG: hypothetical protein IPJ93_06465 [Bacteroidota bacterium]